MIRIPEGSTPDFKNKSWTIAAQVTIPQGWRPFTDLVWRRGRLSKTPPRKLGPANLSEYDTGLPSYLIDRLQAKLFFLIAGRACPFVASCHSGVSLEVRTTGARSHGFG